MQNFSSKSFKRKHNLQEVTTYKYDVCVSFAGEDREIVEPIVLALKEAGIKVFYDKIDAVNLWGRDLAQEFDIIYRKSSRYFIPFISQNYKNKIWTKHEFRTALDRSLQEEYGYILPVKLDNTELDGLRSTVGYVNYQEYKTTLVEMIIEKVTNSSTPSLVAQAQDHPINIRFSVKMISPGKYSKFDCAFSFGITCLAEPYRYVNTPMIVFNEPIGKNADAITFLDLQGPFVKFPSKLEYGQVLNLSYRQNPKAVDSFRRLNPDISFYARATTTLGEEFRSPDIKVEKLISDLSVFYND